MKITSTENSLPMMNFQNSSTFTKRRNKKAESEFDTILNAYITEAADELEEYSINLPQHHVYWDNGYYDERRW